MKWKDRKTIIRRYLRDPDENIWDDDIIMDIWNAEQNDIQRRYDVLEDVTGIPVPPFYHMAYIYDWEYTHSGGADYINVRQALVYVQQGDIVVTQEWEIEQYWGLFTPGDTSKGTRVTQPFETWFVSTSSQEVRFKFPDDMDEVKYLAWDRKPLDNIDQKQLMTGNAVWRREGGEAFYYWIPDKLENEFVAYPRPSTIPWNDDQDVVESYHYGYTYAFEATDTYISLTGFKFTTLTDDGLTDMVFSSWEEEHNNDIDAETSIYASSLPWAGEGTASGFGMISAVSGDTVTLEVGTIIDREGSYLTQDAGVATDIIDPVSNFLLIYRKFPEEITEDLQNTSWPDFLEKYVMFGALERLYMANNDGRIDSLRDYWSFRKKIAAQVLEQYKHLRKTDRDYRLTTREPGGRTRRRRPRLPSSYPADNY